RTAFFVGWTRKEAYIKARGAGLALSLKQFVVSLTPAAPARLLATHDDPAEHTRWTLADLPPIPGYAAALAAAGNDWHSSCFVLPETSLEILRV
ncbi:MAG: 4'-phosphopantetheinyl transferase superfamily protein, partial [Chloroflexaceae bacterium]|nr:4'-phosphopantetheinyl transferase superfamily protein [Chloroflexaceae bacterium]